MNNQQTFDVIIIGGSYAGLSAALTLGRAIKNTLIIDSGNPCNKQTPQSHNFITHDGHTPAAITAAAKNEVLQYPTVQFLNNKVTDVTGTNNNFMISTDEGSKFTASKILFATGIKDEMPPIEGFADCWGISVIHCPYCHGYEYKGQTTGILMNGDSAADYSKFINNWTANLTLYTNGPSALSEEQRIKTVSRNIRIVEKVVEKLNHEQGHLKSIVFTDGTKEALNALYSKPGFKQHCDIPALLGCAINEQQFIQVDEFKKTTVAGIYAAGDNATLFRSVAQAVAAGTVAGAMINHEIINES